MDRKRGGASRLRDGPVDTASSVKDAENIFFDVWFREFDSQGRLRGLILLNMLWKGRKGEERWEKQRQSGRKEIESSKKDDFSSGF